MSQYLSILWYNYIAEMMSLLMSVSVYANVGIISIQLEHTAVTDGRILNALIVRLCPKKFPPIVLFNNYMIYVPNINSNTGFLIGSTTTTTYCMG